MKTILIISPEAWTAHTVSKHHYAMTLAARGSTVYFLNPPDNGLRTFHFEDVAGHPGLRIVSAPQVARGLRFYPPILRRWLEARWLSQFEQAAGHPVDVVWLFENSRFFDLGFAGQRLKIYHQVDLNQVFSPKWAASTADICLCTTDLIRARLLPANSATYKIHHGLAQVDSPASLTSEQAAWFDTQGPHAVYIGNLEMEYLDVDLLARLPQHAPHVRFHFVGGSRNDGALRQKAAAFPNVTWWGRVDSTLIPAILERADVLLVTYQAARYKDQASPHKFMEYLASGKVIVASYTDEYRDKRHLLEMVDAPEEYLATLDRVIADLSEYNSPKRQEARRAFANEHTYEKQLDRIDDLLRKHRLGSQLNAQ